MQKALRIRVQATRQSLKQTEKRKAQHAKSQLLEYERAKQNLNKTRRDFINNERKARREDWNMGPLAPNRDHGLDKGKFGALDIQSLRRPHLTDKMRTIPKRRKEADGYQNTFGFKGKTMIGNVVEGDRVAVVEGSPHIKGQVGFVLSLDEDTECVRIANVNVADVSYPDFMPKPPPNPNDPNSGNFTAQEILVPMKDVRLVAQITGPDGNTKDVLVRHVHADGPYQDRPRDSLVPNHTRYISGTAHLSGTGEDIVIPWPAADYGAENMDEGTGKEDQITWNPSLTWSPLGYTSDLSNAREILSLSKTAPYYMGDLESVPADQLSSADRAGLRGIADDNDHYEWTTRVSAGIMEELSGKSTRRQLANVDKVTQKMLSDARSHWWEDRKLLSPQTEALQRAAQQKRLQRQAAIESNATLLQQNIEGLLAPIKALSPQSKIQYDRKLRRTIAYERKSSETQA